MKKKYTTNKPKPKSKKTKKSRPLRGGGSVPKKK